MAAWVEGIVAWGFERVAEVFTANAAEHGDTASQCCVHIDGEPVIDLRAGLDDDAVMVVFSATKGATAACANLLVQRGLLDLDAPVADYWPEYGVNGKDATLVRWLLSHRSGVLAPEPGPTMDDLADWDLMTAALASRSPAWSPGSAYGYQAHSFGWLVGELVRRLSSPAMPVEQRFGRGFMVPPAEESPTGTATFGHEGAGGTTAFADPGNRLAFAYATTRIALGPPGTDPRAAALIASVYRALR